MCVYYAENRSEPYTQTQMNESDFLQTEVWKKLREKRLKIDFYRCHYCGSAINVQVHHLHYPDAWGLETMEDLVTLCDNCHAKVHNKEIRNGNQTV